MPRLTTELIRRLPKVVLHDDLLGGARPTTLIDLAQDAGATLPVASDPDRLAGWFAEPGDDPDHDAARSEAVVSLIRTPEALVRLARECVLDLAADGAVYAEVRFAPERHAAQGLEPEGAVRAVVEGLRVGAARARLRGHDITPRLILTTLRQSAEAMEVADLAVRHRGAGVVGVDFAGPAAGHAPSRHLAACEFVRRENFHLTVHAGQGPGTTSLADAVHTCVTDRLGHGVRLAEDILTSADGAAKLGPLATYVRDRRLPLEVSPGAEVRRGLVPSLAEHPVEVLRRHRFRVTVGTGSRMLGQASLTREFADLAAVFGYTLEDLSWFTVNAMKSAFLGHDERLRLINHAIKPGYARERVHEASAAFFRREDPW